MTSVYNQAMTSDRLFAELTNEERLNELATFVVESGPGPMQRDVELFEKRLDYYAGMAGIDIVKARINVHNRCHKIFNHVIEGYGLDVK